MYWPFVGFSISAASGRLNSGETDAIAAAAATMLKAIKTAGQPNFGATVQIVNSSKQGLGKRATVDRVFVGNRPDHIESRENAALEVYSIATV
jgi:hypothetical protein